MSIATPGTAPARPDLAARALLLLVAVIWGFNWPAGRFALHDLSPWTFRAVSFGLGAAILMAAARWTGASLHVERGLPRLHLAIAGLLSTGGYGLLAAFAMLGTSTSRTAICAYTMPIWATFLARLVLKERLTAWRIAALVLGSLGLGILLWPLVADGVPVGVLYAIGSAVSWAAGTIYLKWAGVTGHPIAIAAWQLVAGTAMFAVGMVVHGVDPTAGLHALPMLGFLYSTVIGTALAYLLWFQLVVRLPAGTAGLGTLLVPVVGVAASIALMGERPSGADFAGFALIFAAGLSAVWSGTAKRAA